MATVIPATPQQQQAAQFFAPLPTSAISGLMRLFGHLARVGKPTQDDMDDIADLTTHPLLTQPLYQGAIGEDIDRKMSSQFGFMPRQYGLY